MNSLILRVTSRALLLLLLLYSVFLFLRGHDLPGGGFVGGLVGASAWALYGIAHGTNRARYALRVDPRDLLGSGLLLAALSGFIPLFAGLEQFRAMWLEVGGLRLGTPLLFDLGVYLIVVGGTLTSIFALEED